MVVEAGVTERIAGLAATPDWVSPSDQLTVQGGFPVNAAWIVALDPAQTETLPLTCAAGRGFTVTVTDG